MTAPPAPPPGYYAPPGRMRIPRRPNTAGLVIASIGGAAAVVGGLLPWYSGAGNDIHVVDIVHSLDAVQGHDATQAWLSWALWAVLALATVSALFANVPGPLSTPLRVIGPILGGVGAVATLVALDDLLADGASLTDHSQAGLWMVIFGLVAVGIAAVPGPNRIRPMPYGMPYPGGAYPAAPYPPGY